MRRDQLAISNEKLALSRQLSELKDLRLQILEPGHRKLPT